MSFVNKGNLLFLDNNLKKFIMFIIFVVTLLYYFLLHSVYRFEFIDKFLFSLETFNISPLNSSTVQRRSKSTVAEKITCVKERLEGILPIDENPETADNRNKS